MPGHPADAAGRLAAPATALRWLPAAAALALVLGGLVYLLDRPTGSAWLMPAQWQATWQATWQAGTPGTWFGSAGAWLPSFVHAFAFSVLTAWVLPGRPGMDSAACVGWAAVDTLAECAQLPALAGPLAAALHTALDGAPIATQVGGYFMQGSFAGADVAAGLAGAAFAFAALRVAAHRAGRGERHLQWHPEWRDST